MKDNKPIIKSDLKTLLRRYSRSDAITNLEQNYNAESVHKIKPSQIVLPKYLEKVVFSDIEINSFADDIKDGLYQPFVVRQKSNGEYEIIIGLRLLLGAKKLNFQSVNCLIRSFSDEEALLIIASYLREQKYTDVIEEAYICYFLKTDFGYKNKDLGFLFRESPSQISNILQLLTLKQSIITKIATKEISYGHAKAFSRLDENNVDFVVNEILKNKLSVRETEQLVHSIINKLPANRNIQITKNRITLIFDNDKDKQEALKRIEKLVKRKKIKL